MAKGRPNAYNIKQGQTLFVVSCGAAPERYRFRHSVMTVFLHSHKTKLPPRGCIVTEVPVSFVRSHLKACGNQGFFFSRKRAFTYCKELNRREQLRVSKLK